MRTFFAENKTISAAQQLQQYAACLVSSTESAEVQVHNMHATILSSSPDGGVDSSFAEFLPSIVHWTNQLRELRQLGVKVSRD